MVTGEHVARMRSHVNFHINQSFEGLFTVSTGMRLLVSVFVTPLVNFKLAQFSVLVPTRATSMWFLAGMGSHVDF